MTRQAQCFVLPCFQHFLWTEKYGESQTFSYMRQSFNWRWFRQTLYLVFKKVCKGFAQIALDVKSIADDTFIVWMGDSDEYSVLISLGRALCIVEGLLSVCSSKSC